MIAALISLQVLDIISTYLCLKSESGAEANPWLAKLMAKIGLLPALVLAKGLFIAMLILWGYLVPTAFIVVMIAFYVYVVVNNFKILRGRR